MKLVEGWPVHECETQNHGRRVKFDHSSYIWQATWREPGTIVHSEWNEDKTQLVTATIAYHTARGINKCPFCGAELPPYSPEERHLTLEELERQSREARKQAEEYRLKLLEEQREAAAFLASFKPYEKSREEIVAELAADYMTPARLRALADSKEQEEKE